MDEAIEMLFDVDLGGPKKTSIRCGAHRHNLMNTTVMQSYEKLL